MPLKVCHTADFHLGMKFSGYGELQDRLSEARFQTLGRIVAKANEASCDLLVIAGDMFERVTVGGSVIRKCAETLNQFEGDLVAVLPGNHDYFTSESDLWTRFKDQAGDRVILLEEECPYELGHYGLNAVLYPAPCSSRYSSDNGIEWIQQIQKNPDIVFHIGVAHGNLEGCGWDEHDQYFPMTQAELDVCKLDLWLLGHIHVPFPQGTPDGKSVFYAGVPEPDGFDCRHEGNAWIIELDDGKRTHVQAVGVGTYRFQHDEIEVIAEKDLKDVLEKFSEETHENTLLKLKLKGRLPREVHGRLKEIRDGLEAQLLYLQLNDHEVAVEITADDIDREFTQDSFPHRLLSELGQKEEDSEALQIAYSMLKEVQR